ncbi:MAG: 16S rRNA (uracil(1498)-N(3))-methyltransferase [Spirochaetaceae bacterium]|jgi:16S rRNA (uracil1498-N3)-methyltransferase|nr:16S rRNA (uracil(1498)-N(3))-methyltransferase [Spirochaetaceae bacterium]
MKQFILPSPPDKQGRICLSGADYHYLVKVRRAAPGGVFDARLPSGETALVRVCSVEKNRLTGVCIPRPTGSEEADAPEGVSLPPMVLFQALPKGSKMDLIVRQAAEGGLSEVVPFCSEFTVPRIGTKGEEKRERWQRIVKEARQQSNSPVSTAVRPPCTGDALGRYWQNLREQYPRALGLLLHQAPLAKGSLHGYLSRDPELVVLAVGPEGGFSPGEAAWFLALGFNPIVIGNTIFRVETAALYAAAAVRTILLERASWMLKIPNP